MIEAYTKASETLVCGEDIRYIRDTLDPNTIARKVQDLETGMMTYGTGQGFRSDVTKSIPSQIKFSKILIWLEVWG